MRHSRLCLVVTCGLLVAAAGGVPGSRDLPVDSPIIATRHVDPQQQPDAALQRGVEWLCRQQQGDGGWHSDTYGQMRCGVGNTALTVFALANLPSPRRDQRVEQAIDRGLKFLMANLDATGFVRAIDGSSDYPTYATALTVLALHKHGKGSFWSNQNRRMLRYLLASQQTSRQGWTTKDPEFGGWNHIGGADDVQFRMPGEVDLSVTTLALEALATAPQEEEMQANTDGALRFLSRCQHAATSEGGEAADAGGFAFFPAATDPRNKAGLLQTGSTSKHARSYGTTTADGWRALRACGLSDADSRVQTATNWLKKHATEAIVPGFPDAEGVASFRAGLRYYYAASMARVSGDSSALEIHSASRELQRWIVSQQQSDGSWQNPVAVMHEDDPLIATSLAVIALGAL